MDRIQEEGLREQLTGGAGVPSSRSAMPQSASAAVDNHFWGSILLSRAGGAKYTLDSHAVRKLRTQTSKVFAFKIRFRFENAECLEAAGERTDAPRLEVGLRYLTSILWLVAAQRRPLPTSSALTSACATVGLPAGREETYASGRLVLSGGVDAHYHLDQPTGDGSAMADDSVSGARSTACGGTTRVMPFAAQMMGQSVGPLLRCRATSSTEFAEVLVAAAESCESITGQTGSPAAAGGAPAAPIDATLEARWP